MAKKRKVLFVDRRNDLQSQIAEFFLEQNHGEFFESYSAAGAYDIVDCELIGTMLSLGHDIRRHFSKHFDAVAGMEFDYLVVLDDLDDDALARAPKHDKLIKRPFSGRESFQATDDQELDECYRTLINDVQAWVEATFSSYGAADAASR